MRRTLFIGLLALLSLGLGIYIADKIVRPQRPAYRVVFDLTSRDTLEQKAVLRWIREVGTSSPDAQMEVVMYGKGFELVMPERSAYIADVKGAMKNPKVAFKVCAIALRNNNLDKSQLLPGVETVPDGIYELVSKQQDNWGYIKVMH
jgi:intracellular sulfur oxidation DsrE/DsrF family protein